MNRFGRNHVFNSSRLLDSILDPLGRLLGAFLAPKIAQTRFWTPPGPIQTYIDRLLAAPRALSRQVLALARFCGRPPGAEQAVLGAPGGLQEAPKRPQEASRADLAAMLPPCWSHFGAPLKRFCHHVGHIASLKAPSTRALDPRSQARRNARSD